MPAAASDVVLHKKTLMVFYKKDSNPFVWKESRAHLNFAKKNLLP